MYRGRAVHIAAGSNSTKAWFEHMVLSEQATSLMAQDYAVVLLCNHCRVEQHKGCSMLMCATKHWLAVALQDTAVGYLGNRYSGTVHCRSKQTY